MRILDICCCSGGASMGLYQACRKTGIEPYVCGADIRKPDSYPFEFIQSDIRELSLDFIRSFDFVWLSPPCQAYSLACVGSSKEYPDLVPFARNLMYRAGVPYCMENVPQAPLRRDLLLCGEMFDLGVIRHRHFEISGFEVPQPFHKMHSGRVIDGEKVTVAGNGFGGSGKIEDWQKAIGIDWITDRWSLAQAVPPVYSQYIMSCFLGEPDYSLLVDDLPVSSDGWYYQQEMIQCGKPNCKCQRGELHGPYWMRYKQIGKRRVKQYVGKSYVFSCAH
ncbi:MAG: DUF6788 family protein [Clostridium sp.]|nr:DUF6788 family protein [Clostridium sp.]